MKFLEVTLEEGRKHLIRVEAVTAIGSHPKGALLFTSLFDPLIVMENYDTIRQRLSELDDGELRHDPSAAISIVKPVG